MKPLVIFKAGDTFSQLARELGDFEQWIIDTMGPLPFPVQVIDVRQASDLPSCADIAGAIITGSHSMVSDREAWSEALAAWLRTAVSAELPIFGICYGHQLLAHALGGEVGYHPGGIELGSVSIRLTAAAQSDPLFASLPADFPAHVVHRQSVLRLPKAAVLLAANAFEPHHAYRVGQNAWGVQFHPEFSTEAMAGYIQEITKDAETDGQSPASSLAKLAETSAAASLLPRFALLLKERLNT